MEYIKQDIQDATSYYLVTTSTPDTNIVDTAGGTINYIKAFLQPHHSYHESPTTQYHITPDISTEARAPNTATATASMPNASSPTNPLSNSTKEPSNFLYPHPTYNTRGYPTSLPNYT